MAAHSSAALEAYLLTPAPSPALESLRVACLNAVSITQGSSATRTLIRRVYDTELKTIFTGLVELPSDYFDLTLPAPRRWIEADALLQPQQNYHADIFRELGKLKLPRVFMDMISTYLTDAGYLNRVAGYCSLVLLTTLLQRDA